MLCGKEIKNVMFKKNLKETKDLSSKVGTLLFMVRIMKIEQQYIIFISWLSNINIQIIFFMTYQYKYSNYILFCSELSSTYSILSRYQYLAVCL